MPDARRGDAGVAAFAGFGVCLAGAALGAWSPESYWSWAASASKSAWGRPCATEDRVRTLWASHSPKDVSIA